MQPAASVDEAWDVLFHRDGFIRRADRIDGACPVSGAGTTRCYLWNDRTTGGLGIGCGEHNRDGERQLRGAARRDHLAALGLTERETTMTGKPIVTGQGYAVADAETKESRNGNPYTKIRVRVFVEDKDEDVEDWPEPWWLTLMVFGRAVDRAAEVCKGDTCSFQGTLDRRHYEGRDGEQRVSWTVLCDGFAASVQPTGHARGGGDDDRAANGGGGQRAANGGGKRKAKGRGRPAAPPPQDDEIDESDIPF